MNMKLVIIFDILFLEISPLQYPILQKLIVFLQQKSSEKNTLHIIVLLTFVVQMERALHCK